MGSSTMDLKILLLFLTLEEEDTPTKRFNTIRGKKAATLSKVRLRSSGVILFMRPSSHRLTPRNTMAMKLSSTLTHKITKLRGAQ